MRPVGIPVAATLTAALLAAALLVPEASMADGLDGFMELDFDNNTAKSMDSNGNATNSRSTDLTHKYYLNLTKTFAPNLRLNSGGIFERTDSSSTTGAFSSKSQDTNTKAFTNLILSTPVYNASAGYDKRVEKQSTQGSPPANLANEDYTATLGFRPAGLPSVDLRLSRTYNYDYRRVVQDLTTDAALLSVKYVPIKQVDLRYTATYTNPDDKLSSTKTKDLLQTARSTYTDTFFNKRTAVYLDYNFSNRDTTTTTAGSGTVTTQLSPLSGLSLIEGFIDLPAKDVLNPNPAIIDGNLATSGGINIGFSPRVAGDNRLRDMGFGFADNTSVMNTIWVWVDRNLPAGVWGSFSFQVYKSDDNQDWSLVDGAPSVTFGTFQDRFELTFSPAVGARFIKVVARPLNPAVTSDPRFSDIFVTELQAFLIVPASGTRRTTTATAHIMNVSVKTKILGRPNLSHDFNLYLIETTAPKSLTTYFMTNGLSLNQKLGRYFTVNARASREDNEQAKIHESAYAYSASVTAVPIETLSHSLIYSGRTDQRKAGSSSSDSFTLFNKAELYKGIDAYLGLGLNFAGQDNGVSSGGRLMNLGASFVPHRTTTFNLAYVYSNNRQSGGNLRASSSTSDRVDASVSFNPVRAVYLFSSLSKTTSNRRSRTLVNYGLNFSPFPDGDLQFHFSYTENLGPASEGTTKLISPTLRWNIRTGAYLDVSYTISQSKSSVGSTESRTFNTSLKVAL